jgi:hypothetical protein
MRLGGESGDSFLPSLEDVRCGSVFFTADRPYTLVLYLDIDEYSIGTFDNVL